MKTFFTLILISTSLFARQYNRYENHHFWGRPYYNTYDENRWIEVEDEETPVYYDRRIDQEGLLINETTIETDLDNQ